MTDLLTFFLKPTIATLGVSLAIIVPGMLVGPGLSISTTWAKGHLESSEVVCFDGRFSV